VPGVEVPEVPAVEVPPVPCGLDPALPVVALAPAVPPLVPAVPPAPVAPQPHANNALAKITLPTLLSPNAASGDPRWTSGLPRRDPLGCGSGSLSATPIVRILHKLAASDRSRQARRLSGAEQTCGARGPTPAQRAR